MEKSGLSTDVLDFTEAAEKTIHSVVHKKCPNHGKQSHIRIFYGYKGGQSQEKWEQVLV
jgi:RecA/RadA recombinase